MDASRRFADTLALHDLTGVPDGDLVGAATDLVADGCEAEAVVALACLIPSVWLNPFEFDAALDAARRALALPPLPMRALQLRASQAQARRWRAGRLTDDALTTWAYTSYGQEDGDGALARLAELHIFFSYLDEIVDTEEQLHARVRAAVDEILARPDPWAIAP